VGVMTYRDGNILFLFFSTSVVWSLQHGSLMSNEVADTRGAQDEPHIQVKSEEEQDRMLLETRIIKDDGYQKQQGMFSLPLVFPCLLWRALMHLYKFFFCPWTGC